ncbi:MAG: hypothetical protein KZQ64_08885 [gamma proteobacterium symbiont of Bathyaustriella thionipta]|nr:hypothetical protein [gamma proteobacterium symbiont of Bathyaustriella thionipta]
MTAVNTAIENRIIRSGQFIIVHDEHSSNVQLSGIFENKEVISKNCMEKYEQFSMELKNSETGQAIWTDKKRFK